MEACLYYDQEKQRRTFWQADEPGCEEKAEIPGAL